MSGLDNAKSPTVLDYRQSFQEGWNFAPSEYLPHYVVLNTNVII